VRHPQVADQWFGRDLQGYDVYARSIYGARASILVGLLTTCSPVLLGVASAPWPPTTAAGSTAGHARITDVFFAIPFLLGGILFMSTFPNTANSSYASIVGKVVLALSVLGWPEHGPTDARRGLQVKPNDYVQAARRWARAPGASSAATSCPMRWHRSWWSR
jgi:oligopeptide transport system permease protein